MRNKNIITGALILTSANIITRILGFVYRVYMSNIVGAEGMGLYQLVVPIYSLAWSIACSGFTTTVSKLTAQEKAKGEYGNMGKILKQSVIITTTLGLIVGLCIYFFSEEIAVYFFKDERTILSLKILSFAIPFMASGSCIRGYFLGLQETLVPAINQVLEQCIRMAIIYLLAGTFMPLGIEYACAAAVIGIVAEEVFSLVFVLVAYKKFKVKNILNKRPSLSTTQSLFLIFSMALPLTANRVTGSLLTTVENILIPQRLQMFGYSAKEAISIFGQISGMAMPLIFFPAAFLTSLSISLVPAVSEASAVRNFKRINYTVTRSMLFASVIGFGAASLFISFSFDLGYVIYKQDISHILMLLGVMCPFLYMQIVLSGILNGLGYQVFIFRNSLLSSMINIAFIYFLTPLRGVDAFLIGWFVSLIIVCWLEIEKLRTTVDLQFEFSNWFLKPFIAALATGLTVRFVTNKIIFDLLGNTLGLITAILVLLVLYFIFIILTGCLSLNDFKDILKGIKPNKTESDKLLA